MIRFALLMVMLIVSVLPISKVFGQGTIYGDLEIRNDYYVRDSLIGASNTAQYDNLKSSVDAWLTVNYANPEWDFDASVRLDGFLHSNLFNPGREAYTGFGIGRFHLRKTVNNLEITGGYIYDQLGSGLIFRAYEDRALGIDDALVGVRTDYKISEAFSIKAMAGMRKQRLGMDRSVIAATELKSFQSFGKEKDWNMSSGIAAVNRTLDQESMDAIVAIINSYPLDERFLPTYNSYAFSAYNQLNHKRWGWYLEGAWKSKDLQLVSLTEPLQLDAGSALFTTVSYAKPGLGATLLFKRTDNFQSRSNPLGGETILNSAINFLPPANRQLSLRLPARYQPASQEIREMGLSLDVNWKMNKSMSLHGTYSQIHDLGATPGDFINDLLYARGSISGLNSGKTEGALLFKEVYLDVEWKHSKKWKGLYGMYYTMYNRLFYEGEGLAQTFVYSPFFRWTHRISRKVSMKYELQYQHTVDDFGQWVYGMIQLNLPPKLSFAISDMWNLQTGPNVLSVSQEGSKSGIHYYSIFMSYTEKQHRLSLNYAKQVAGIVCTGGVCRYEPAFNGFRVNLVTSF